MSNCVRVKGERVMDGPETRAKVEQVPAVGRIVHFREHPTQEPPLAALITGVVDSDRDIVGLMVFPVPGVGSIVSHPWVQRRRSLNDNAVMNWDWPEYVPPRVVEPDALLSANKDGTPSSRVPGGPWPFEQPTD